MTLHPNRYFTEMILWVPLTKVLLSAPAVRRQHFWNLTLTAKLEQALAPGENRLYQKSYLPYGDLLHLWKKISDLAGKLATVLTVIEQLNRGSEFRNDQNDSNMRLHRAECYCFLRHVLTVRNFVRRRINLHIQNKSYVIGQTI